MEWSSVLTLVEVLVLLGFGYLIVKWNTETSALADVNLVKADVAESDMLAKIDNTIKVEKT